MSEETKTPEPQLCQVCSLYFGSAATGFLCSKCYKARQASSVQDKPTDFVVPTHIPKEESKESSTPDDQGKCQVCKVRIGVIEFQCKCGHSFCTRHRVPEQHACTFDYRVQGIRKLSESNPLVAAEKVTKF